jgi:hypothetical protein
MSGGDHTCPSSIPLPPDGVPVYDYGREIQAMIRPSAEDINAIVDTTREWPADARARLIERLKAADAERSSGTMKIAGGPTAAELIARFGQPGPGPSDETVKLWIREHKEAQGGR